MDVMTTLGLLVMGTVLGGMGAGAAIIVLIAWGSRGAAREAGDEPAGGPDEGEVKLDVLKLDPEDVWRLRDREEIVLSWPEAQLEKIVVWIN